MQAYSILIYSCGVKRRKRELQRCDREAPQQKKDKLRILKDSEVLDEIERCLEFRKSARFRI
jgi:hypothetical protein